MTTCFLDPAHREGAGSSFLASCYPFGTKRTLAVLLGARPFTVAAPMSLQTEPVVTTRAVRQARVEAVRDAQAVKLAKKLGLHYASTDSMKIARKRRGEHFSY